MRLIAAIRPQAGGAGVDAQANKVPERIPTVTFQTKTVNV